MDLVYLYVSEAPEARYQVSHPLHVAWKGVLEKPEDAAPALAACLEITKTPHPEGEWETEASIREQIRSHITHNMMKAGEPLPLWDMLTTHMRKALATYNVRYNFVPYTSEDWLTRTTAIRLPLITEEVPPGVEDYMVIQHFDFGIGISYSIKGKRWANATACKYGGAASRIFGGGGDCVQYIFAIQHPMSTDGGGNEAEARPGAAGDMYA